MIQMDMFNSSKEDYLYNQLQKLENSMDRRTKSIFAMLTELQTEVMNLKEKKEK